MKFHHSDCCESPCDTCGSGCGGCANGSCGGSVGGPVIGAPIGAPQMGTPATGKPAERLKMPKGDGDKGTDKGVEKGAQTMVPAPILTPTGGKIEEVKNPFELDRRLDQRVARAADYSHLTGQLSYVHADGGLWVLRYAPLAQEDAHGGSVVLARDHRMDSYREGDLVTVEGQVLKQRGSAHLGGPLYQIRTISLVDRPQQ
jgi:hypothetical protein